MTSERLTEIRERLSGVTLELSPVFAMDLLAMSDDLLAEVERLREEIADARMYCSRSTFCVTIPPTKGETDE